MWKMSDWRDTCTEFKCVSHAWNHNVAISVLLFSNSKNASWFQILLIFLYSKKKKLACNKTILFQLFIFLSLTIY